MMPGKDAATIQGAPDNEITPEDALEIGKTLGMQYKSITVGRNMHRSSTMILNGLISGMTCTGANVRDAGILPTPAIPYASDGTDCCVMIGNPEDHDRVSGLTFINTDGRLFNSPQMFALKNRLESEKILSDHTHVGKIDKYNGATDKYIKKVTEFVGSADCQLIVDCCGADSASNVIPVVMNRIGADTVMVNCQTDLRKRGTWAQPEEYNMRILSKIVKANYGSIGVALNCDGTRIAALDEAGNFLNGETVLQLLIKFLNPKRVVVPIDTTMAVKDLTKGYIRLCGIGSENLGETVKNDGANLGGSSDGSFVFKDISFSVDGITATAMLARIATETSLREEVEQLPRYHREEATVGYTGNREIIAKRISAKVDDLDYAGMSVVDGWRVDLESGWFLLRFSDEYNNIDIKVEGTDKIYAAGLMEIAKEVVASSIKDSR